MRRLTACLLLLALPGLAGAAPASDAVSGIWLDSAKDGYIQIYQTDEGTFAGRVVGATDGDVRDDTENPDPAKRDQSLLGKRILHGFEYNGEGRWEGGRIYDPKKGKTYDAWLALNDEGNLKVHGYIGVSLLGRTKIFTPASRDDTGVKSSALVATE